MLYASLPLYNDDIHYVKGTFSELLDLVELVCKRKSLQRPWDSLIHLK